MASPKKSIWPTGSEKYFDLYNIPYELTETLLFDSPLAERSPSPVQVLATVPELDLAWELFVMEYTGGTTGFEAFFKDFLGGHQWKDKVRLLGLV